MAPFGSQKSRANIGRHGQRRSQARAYARNHPISFGVCSVPLQEILAGLYLLSSLGDQKETPSTERLIVEIVGAATRLKCPVIIKAYKVVCKHKGGQKYGKLGVEIRTKRRFQIDGYPPIIRLWDTPEQVLFYMRKWASKLS